MTAISKYQVIINGSKLCRGLDESPDKAYRLYQYILSHKISILDKEIECLKK